VGIVGIVGMFQPFAGARARGQVGGGKQLIDAHNANNAHISPGTFALELPARSGAITAVDCELLGGGDRIEIVAQPPA
jgi:hypothetical protein